MGVFGCLHYTWLARTVVIGCSVACIAVGARQNSIVGSCKIASRARPARKAQIELRSPSGLSACKDRHALSQVWEQANAGELEGQSPVTFPPSSLPPSNSPQEKAWPALAPRPRLPWARQRGSLRDYCLHSSLPPLHSTLPLSTISPSFFPLIRLVHSHWTIGFGGLEAARFSSPELKATATGSSDGGGTSSLMKKQINIANIDARGVASAGSKGSGGAAWAASLDGAAVSGGATLERRAMCEGTRAFLCLFFVFLLLFFLPFSGSNIYCSC